VWFTPQIHRLPCLYGYVDSPMERQLKAIPAHFCVSGLFQLGVEISGSILRNHPGDKVCGGNSRCASGWKEFAFSLYRTIDVVKPNCHIRVFVMSYVVDLVLLEKLRRNDPGSFRDNFVCPLAVTNVLTSLLVIHYGIRLVVSDKVIRTDPDQ